MEKLKTTFALTGLLAAGAAPGAVAQERPNILWLTIEDTSPYDFGCYGNPNVHTPTIDSLARTGVQYMNMYSVGTQSSPSRSCIITGCYPSTYCMDWHRGQYATPRDIFFPEYLRTAGYYCTNKSKTDYNTTVDNQSIWDECGAKATYNNPDRKPGQPFFAVFNCMATHMSRITSYHTDGRRDFAAEGLDPAQLHLPPHVPDLPEVRSDFAFHMEGSQDIDGWVRLFLDDLKAQGLDQNTIVFFFSDHGGCLPRGKGFIFDTGIRVPFIVHFPPKWRHLAATAQGAPCTRLSSFADLAPTVLSLAGVEAPEYMQGRAFLGKYAAPAKPYEYCMTTNQGGHFSPERIVTDGRYKYVRRFIPYRHDALMNAFQWGMPSNLAWDALYLSGKYDDPAVAATFERRDAELFFDTQADPWEMHNLLGDPRHAARIEAFRQEMSRLIHTQKDLGFFPPSARDKQTPLYHTVRKAGYPLDSLYRLVELTDHVSPKDFPELVRLLRAPEYEIRYWAVVNINQLSAQNQLRETPRELLDILSGDRTEIACEAAYARCRTGYAPETMAYLMRRDNPRNNQFRYNQLELLSLEPAAAEYFTAAITAALRQEGGSGTPKGAPNDESTNNSISARKILVNLRLLPARKLWPASLYEEGLKVNRHRRPLVPTPDMTSPKRNISPR